MKINYKGTNRIKDWEYVCEDCKLHETLTHLASDDMHCHKCKDCGSSLLRYIDKAPLLDADYHQGHKSYNIGWES